MIRCQAKPAVISLTRRAFFYVYQISNEVPVHNKVHRSPHHERDDTMHDPQQPSCVIEELDEKSDGSWEVVQGSKASSSSRSLSASSLREAPPAPATPGAQPTTAADSIDDLHDAVDHQSDDYHSCDDDNDAYDEEEVEHQLVVNTTLHRRVPNSQPPESHIPPDNNASSLLPQPHDDDQGEDDQQALSPEQRAVRGGVSLAAWLSRPGLCSACSRQQKPSSAKVTRRSMQAITTGHRCVYARQPAHAPPLMPQCHSNYMARLWTLPILQLQSVQCTCATVQQPCSKWATTQPPSRTAQQQWTSTRST